MGKTYKDKIRHLKKNNQEELVKKDKYKKSKFNPRREVDELEEDIKARLQNTTEESKDKEST